MAELGRSRMAAGEGGGHWGVNTMAPPSTHGGYPYRPSPHGDVSPNPPWGQGGHLALPRHLGGVGVGGRAVLPHSPPPSPPSQHIAPHSLLLRSETDCSAELFFSSAAFCCWGRERRRHGGCQRPRVTHLPPLPPLPPPQKKPHPGAAETGQLVSLVAAGQALTFCFTLVQLGSVSLQRLWMVTLQAGGGGHRERCRHGHPRRHQGGAAIAGATGADAGGIRADAGHAGSRSCRGAAEPPRCR